MVSFCFDPTDYSNYWAIVLQEIGYKVVASLLKYRLEEHDKYKGGFCKERSITDSYAERNSHNMLRVQNNSGYAIRGVQECI